MDAPLLLPPPTESPFNKPRSPRRPIKISASAPEVLVEMLDSALKELVDAEEASSWAQLRSEFYVSPEYDGPQEVDSDVEDAQQKLAWCKMKADIALEIAVNPPHKFSGSGSVLISASCIGNVEVVLALLDSRECIRVRVNDTLPHGMTALAYAVQGPMPGSRISATNYLKIVEALLKAGADVHIADIDGKTILSRAIDCGQKDIVTMLRAHGAV